MPIDKSVFVYGSSKMKKGKDIDDLLKDLYDISTYLEQHPDFVITIIISTPFSENVNHPMYGTGEGEGILSMVKNRVQIIKDIIQNSGPKVGGSQVKTRINWESSKKMQLQSK